MTQNTAGNPIEDPPDSRSQGHPVRLIKAQLGYLFYGLVVLLPLGILFFVLSALLGAIDSTGRSVLGHIIPAEYIFTGYGIVLAVVFMYLIGLSVRKTWVADILVRIPVLGMFLARGRGGMMSLSKLTNLTPCLFLMSPTCPSYGWVLSHESVKSGDQEKMYELINVYYPNVPTILTGSIFPVRKEGVILLGNKSTEVLDLLLYSLHSPDSLQILPWGDESADHFAKRAAKFGLQQTGG